MIGMTPSGFGRGWGNTNAEKERENITKNPTRWGSRNCTLSFFKFLKENIVAFKYTTVTKGE